MSSCEYVRSRKVDDIHMMCVFDYTSNFQNRAGLHRHRCRICNHLGEVISFLSWAIVAMAESNKEIGMHNYMHILASSSHESSMGQHTQKRKAIHALRGMWSPMRQNKKSDASSLTWSRGITL